MAAYLEEVGTKKRSGENLLNEAKRMRLASLTPSVVGICLRPYSYRLTSRYKVMGCYCAYST